MDGEKLEVNRRKRREGRRRGIQYNRRDMEKENKGRGRERTGPGHVELEDTRHGKGEQREAKK